MYNKIIRAPWQLSNYLMHTYDKKKKVYDHAV